MASSVYDWAYRAQAGRLLLHPPRPLTLAADGGIRPRMLASPSTAFRVRAHPNIALIKYWGKEAGPGNQPAVSSLSLTLDTLVTTTHFTVLDAAASARGDVLEGLVPAAAERALVFLSEMRARARCEGASRLLDRALRINTHNNFPTAAGLASSASGFAALAVGLNTLWDWRQDAKRLSTFAREGSGSAARSLYGGIVRMHLKPLEQGGAYAAPVLDASAWPLRVLVAVVDSREKEVGSTQGMHITQTTSPYWPAWVSSHALDMQDALQAIEMRDFGKLAEVTEASCLKMHASMMSARPGLLYWHPTSVALMHEVRALRKKGLSVAFTLDAGPQVKIVCESKDEHRVREALEDIPGVEHWISCGLGSAPTVDEDTK